MAEKRGRKPKTAAQLKASGSRRGKDREDGVDLERPQSGKGIDSPPSWLNEEEVKIWEDFHPKAVEMKTYQNADHFSFGLFCRAAYDLLQATQALREAGYIYNTYYLSGSGDDAEQKENPKKHPLVDIERIKRDTYNSFADQFGFNPLARTRLQIVPYHAKSIPTPGGKPSGPETINEEEFLRQMGIKKTL